MQYEHVRVDEHVYENIHVVKYPSGLEGVKSP